MRKLNRRFFISLSALGLLSSMASAQDNFPDVPANHWAYQALSELKSAGLLVGYPDGLFRGTRPLSRYEMAVAFHAAYGKLKGMLDGLQGQLDSAKIADQIAPLKDSLAKIQDDIDRIKSLGPDIADLKKASDTFELELEQLGVNVEAMKKNLGDLESRVTALEKKKPVVDIRGDVDFWLGAGTSNYSSYGLNKDGRILGYGGTGTVTELFPPVTSEVGLEHDETLLHEAAFTISGTNEKGPQWTGTFVIGNMFGNFGPQTPIVGFGNQSDVFNPVSPSASVGGLIGYGPGTEDLYIQDLNVRMGGPQANIELGRVGYSLSPYMFQRIDSTSYFSNDRWDDGKYYFDGAIAGGRLGPANLTLFVGRNSGVQTVNGVPFNPVRSGPIGGFLSSDPNVASGVMSFDSTVGGKLDFNLAKRWNLDLGYVVLQSDANNPIDLTQNANHLSVYGADLQGALGSFKLQGGYHKSDIQDDFATVEGKDNSASNVRLGFERSFYNLFAEYRQVEANYVAPGDWGRLGVLRDPTNIKGLRAGGKLKFLKKFTLDAHGDFESGLSNQFASSTYLGSGTAIHGYDVSLNFEASRRLNLFAEYENTTLFNLDTPASYVGSGNPSYRWATFGLGYHFTQNSLFNLQYEIDDIDNDYQVSGGANFHGGFLTSQLTLKF